MKREILMIQMLAMVTSMSAQGESAQKDSLFQDSIGLSEVVVKGTLPKTHVKGDALVTRVAGTTLEHAGTAIDLLDQLAQVNAQDKEVTVQGRGAATLYINGRQVTDMNELVRLQSDEVSRVEVVQNPGARYSASTRAVIRIYKKKPQGEGFSLDNQASYAFQYGNYAMNNLQMNYRHGGLDFGVGLYAGLGMTGKDKMVYENTYLQNLWNQNNDVKIRARNKFISPTITLNWQPSDNQSLGLRYSFDRNPIQDMKGSRLIADIFVDGQAYEHSHSSVSPAYHSWDHSLNAYYSGLSKGWQVDVNADLYIKGGGLDNDVEELVTSFSQPQAQAQTTIVNTRNRTRDNLYAVKATVGHALWGGEVLLGTEDSYMHRTTSYANPQHVVSDNETKINETMLAGFAEYERMFGHLSFSAGIRYEHVNNDYYLYGQRQPDQSKIYNDWFPSVTLGMPVGKIGKYPLQVMASYSRDILRPSYEQLRSNVFYDNKYTIEGGNPNLDPQYNHSLVLTAAWRWMSLSAGYEHIKNESTIFSEPFSEEHPEVSFLHPIEQSPYNSWYVSLDVSPTIALVKGGATQWIPKATVMVRGQNYRAKGKEGECLLNHPILGIKVQNHFMLPRHWIFDVNGSLQSHGDYGNSTFTNVQQAYGFRLRKSWLHDRIELRLAANDIFKQGARRFITYNGVREIDEVDFSRRAFSATLRYQLNTARSKYRGQSAGKSQKSRM